MAINAVGNFDNKSFNGVAFGAYIDRLPKTRKDNMMKSNVLVGSPEIRAMFSNQTGSAYGVIPFKGNIGGKSLNYDGKTNITAESTKTATQGVVVIGRAKAWTEKDFSYDVTSKVDFLGNVAQQISEYWDEENQRILGSILKGIFKMTGTESTKFVNTHTVDLTASGFALLSEEDTPKPKSAKSVVNDKVDATTINMAMQKACGQNKGKFSLIIMNSAVATNLENLNLLEYLKYTDSNGIQSKLNIAQYNGSLVIIDDSITVEDSDKYVTYLFGKGAIAFEDVGAKVPYEMDRDAKTNGGEDTLITRERIVFAPFGISYTNTNQASLSPTDTELENGTNWKIIGDDNPNQEPIDITQIPIARIVSKG